MSKFTPGPWMVGETLRAESLAVIGDGDSVVCEFPSRLGAAVDADARLIAAAPDLLEACQTFAEWLRRESAGSTNEPWAGKRDTPEGEAAWREWYDENLRICDLAQEQVRAAIAKATGETP